MANTESLYQTTPVKPKIANSLQYCGILLPDLKENRKRLSEDMAAHFFGLPSPTVFMDLFMDKAPTAVPSAKFPQAPKSENDMYIPMFKAFKRYKLSPNIPFYVTAHKRLTNKDYRPDGGGADHPTLSERTSGASEPDSDQRQTRSMTGATPAVPASDTPQEMPFDWHVYGLVVEFKDSLKQDPFYDIKEAETKGTIEKSDDDSIQVRGQLAQYAAHMFNIQHRTHIFQLFIVQNFARFIYWDRAGAVVSEKFDYTKDPATLAKFIWYYNHMTAARRGWDPTVSCPTDAELALFRSQVQAFITAMNNDEDSQRDIRGAELTLDENYPPYKMSVVPVKTGVAQTVIVQRSFEVCDAPIGRATRAYLAYSLTEKKLVFLKDSWRVEIMDLTDEDTIYSKLLDCNIPSLPNVLCAGDVKVDGLTQETQSQKVAQDMNAPWRIACSFSRKHMHHRVVQDLAYSLSTVENSREYVEVFRDAFIALEGAHDAGILHRDISFNNIMVNAEGKAVVNDWDHAGKVHRVGGKPHKVYRTGTWPFMSIAMLQDPYKAHDILDDLECMFWSKLFGAFKYFAGNITISMGPFNERETEFIKGITQFVGGKGKRGWIFSSNLTTLAFDCVPLRGLFSKLTRVWRDYYQAQIGSIEAPDDEDVAETYLDLRKKLSKPSYWAEILNTYLKKDGWMQKDLVSDRHPPKPTKVQDKEVRLRLFTGIIDSQLPSTIYEAPEARDPDSVASAETPAPNPSADTADSPLSPLPDYLRSSSAAPAASTSDDQEVVPSLHNPPGPPQSIYHSVGGSGSQHSVPPTRLTSVAPTLNSNGKRSMTVYSLDDTADEEFAGDQSPTPAAKRPKKSMPLRPSSASGSRQHRKRNSHIEVSRSGGNSSTDRNSKSGTH